MSGSYETQAIRLEHSARNLEANGMPLEASKVMRLAAGLWISAGKPKESRRCVRLADKLIDSLFMLRAVLVLDKENCRG